MDPSVGLDGCGKFRPPPGLFFVHTLFVLLCPDGPGCAFCPLLYNEHNTKHHASGGIRTRNPSKRSAADPRLIPLGHWGSIPDRPARGDSLYRLSYHGCH